MLQYYVCLFHQSHTTNIHPQKHFSRHSHKQLPDPEYIVLSFHTGPIQSNPSKIYKQLLHMYFRCYTNRYRKVGFGNLKLTPLEGKWPPKIDPL